MTRPDDQTRPYAAAMDRTPVLAESRLGGTIARARKSAKLALCWPPIGLVRFGSLRRLTPLTRDAGFSRGEPIDRFFIDAFLKAQSGADGYITGDIRGRVLEIGESVYTRKYGGAAVTRSDVLDPSPDHPEATVIADLRDAPHIPDGSFDSIICTQVLMMIYDLHSVMATLHRILAPGGVLLVTVPGISQLCRPDMNLWGDHWRFTTLGVRRLAEEHFPADGVTVHGYGNVLTAAAMLYGLGQRDLRRQELETHDPDYEVIVALRAIKAAATEDAASPLAANVAPGVPARP